MARYFVSVTDLTIDEVRAELPAGNDPFYAQFRDGYIQTDHGHGMWAEDRKRAQHLAAWLEEYTAHPAKLTRIAE